MRLYAKNTWKEALMKQAEYTCVKESKKDVIVPIFADEGICESIKQQLDYDVETLIDPEWKKVTMIPTFGKFPFARFLFLGMGKREAMTSRRMREAFVAVHAHMKAPASLVAKLAVCEQLDIHKVAELFAEMYMLSTYVECKQGKEAEICFDADVMANEDVRDDIQRGINYAKGINLAKDLANMPANYMTPQRLSEEAMELAERLALECTVLNKDDLMDLHAGGLLAVNQGSDQKPCMIVLKYQGGASDDPYIALIGKGLTFDAGGYNIKSDSYGMKYDMCGGADVLGAMEIIASNHFAKNVVAIIPATENLINGSAYKPQDVITTMSGKTVEIVNTDAEGRMILCDAITYAQKHLQNVTKIVDIATLTGACARALGNVYTGVFANDDTFYEEFSNALRESDEKGWRLPLAPEYHDSLASNSADLRNTGKGSAGASTAACFLEEFVEAGTAWIHLDIAGVADDKESGATGVMVRTMANLCR